MKRRDFLKVGALGGLTLGQYLRLVDAGEVEDSTKRSAILVFLGGGPSHLDTFDLKPDAPSEYRGEFRPIATGVSGVEICEHLPRLARGAHRYAILRGVSHNLAAHNLGTTYLFTGNRPEQLLKHPAYGAVAARELECANDLPPYVSIDREPDGPGYLGVQYRALSTGDKPRAGRPFSVRGITLGDGLTLSKVERRRRLLEDLDVTFQDYESSGDQVAALDRFSQRAYDIISSRRTRDAFDLSRESPKVRERFGRHEFAQSLLLASRLIEAGVRFVTVFLDNWDTHNDNFRELERNLLPGLDAGLSGLFETLSEKALLDSTAVMVTGEFGRTPKINGGAGRDHWPQAMSVLMAGGDVHGGQVVGASDAKGAEPASEAFTPEDVAASFYRNMGLDHRKEYHTSTGRPIHLLRSGSVIHQLFA